MQLEAATFKVACPATQPDAEQALEMARHALHARKVVRLLSGDSEHAVRIDDELVAPTRVAVDVRFAFMVLAAVVFNDDTVPLPQQIAFAHDCSIRTRERKRLVQRGRRKPEAPEMARR